MKHTTTAVQTILKIIALFIIQYINVMEGGNLKLQKTATMNTKGKQNFKHKLLKRFVKSY